MEIGDLPLAVGKQGIVRGIGLQHGHLAEAVIVRGAGPQPGLLQGRHRPVHHGIADPAPPLVRNHRAVMGAIDGEATGGGRSVLGPVRNGEVHALHRAQRRAIAVEELSPLVHDGLAKLRGAHRARGRVHPSRMGVEALVDEELAPGAGTVDIQARITGDLRLGAEIEAGVRVDQQQGMARGGVLRCDGNTVGAPLLHRQLREFRHLHIRRPTIEGLKLLERDALDVAADAALGECQRHPWLEPADGLGVGVGMRGEIVVQPVCPGDHQRLQPWRALAISGLEHRRIVIDPGAQVAPDLALPPGEGPQAEIVEIIGLHPREVILGLGIDHAEHGVGVGAAVDMGDAVVVPHDGDPGRFRLPAGSVALAVCRCRKGTARQRHPRPCAQQAQNPDILHTTVSPSAGRQLSACAV